MRKLICMILMLVLTALSAVGYADVAGPIKKTELRTGVIFIWKNTAGKWQKGIAPGDIYDKTDPTTVDLKQQYPNCTIRDITVDPYTDESLEGVDWYPNQFATDTQSYQRFYLRKAVSDLSTQNLSDSANGIMSYTYSGTLTARDNEAINVKTMLGQGATDEVYAMLGVTRDTAPPDIKRAMEDLYPAGGQSANVEGYLYFVPILRSYEIVPAARALKKPLVDVECADPTMPGTKIQVGGVIKNPNDYDVGMTYTLSVNGVVIKSDTTTLKAGRGYGAFAPYNVSPKAKPGSKLRVVLTATIWDPLNTPQRASASDNCDVYVIAADTEFDGGLQPSEIVD